MAYRCKLKDKILYGDRTCKNCEGYPIDPEKPSCYSTKRNGFEDWTYNCSEAVWQDGILKDKQRSKDKYALDKFTIIPQIQGASVKLVYRQDEDGLHFTTLESPDKYFHTIAGKWMLGDMGFKDMITIEELRELSKQHKVIPIP
jgi:hypothetical protein